MDYLFGVISLSEQKKGHLLDKMVKQGCLAKKTEKIPFLEPTYLLLRKYLFMKYSNIYLLFRKPNNFQTKKGHLKTDFVSKTF